MHGTLLNKLQHFLSIFQITSFNTNFVETELVLNIIFYCLETVVVECSSMASKQGTGSPL